jgi:class 3 adenylate cyclase
MSARVMSTAGLSLAAAALALPLLGLMLLLARPSLDVIWEHHPAHFWLVMVVAVLSALLAYATGVAAERRADARVLVVSLAFLSSAGFLGLHALATPGVLLAESNAGFAVATPVGLALGAVFAALSSRDVAGDQRARVLRRARAARWVLLGAMAAWAAASLAELPPLDGAPLERSSAPMTALALPTIAIYAYAAVQYVMLGLRRGAVMPIGMAAAFTLLAEAMVAVAFSRNWQASWWEWHLLMLAAFALVAWSARQQWHEERFSDLYLDDTRSGNRDMSVLFADLQGFTSYSESHSPDDVTAMLNTYFDSVVPVTVRRHGGVVDRLIGDAVLVTFNRNGDQPDHARRAAAAGLDLQKAAADVSAAHPDWPRFRVGINSGEVSVAVLGAAGGRTHTVIGDTVNTASRLEGRAPVGGVAISAETAARLPRAQTAPLGLLELKGKQAPLQAYQLLALDSGDGDRRS